MRLAFTRASSLCLDNYLHFVFRISREKKLKFENVNKSFAYFLCIVFRIDRSSVVGVKLVC